MPRGHVVVATSTTSSFVLPVLLLSLSLCPSFQFALPFENFSRNFEIERLRGNPRFARKHRNCKTSGRRESGFVERDSLFNAGHDDVGSVGDALQEPVLPGNSQIRKQGILSRFQREGDSSGRRAVDRQGFRPIDQRRGPSPRRLHRRQGEGHGAGDAEPNGDSIPRQRRERRQGEEARGIRGGSRRSTPRRTPPLRSSRSSRSFSRFLFFFSLSSRGPLSSSGPILFFSSFFCLQGNATRSIEASACHSRYWPEPKLSSP